MKNFKYRIVLYIVVAAGLLGYELLFVRPVRSFAIIIAIAVIGIAAISLVNIRNRES